MKLYKYRPFNIWALDIIVNNELYLAYPKELNDPMDCAILIDEKREELPTAICSLSKKNNDYLMWSYYADGHKGLCLKLNCNNLIETIDKENRKISQRKTIYMEKVTYYSEAEYRKTVNSMRTERGDIVIDKKNTLLKIKTTNFKHEKEIRLITKSFDIKNKLKVNELVEAVYLGLNMPPNQIKLIQNIVFMINKTSNRDICIYRAKDINKKNQIKFIKIEKTS